MDLLPWKVHNPDKPQKYEICFVLALLVSDGKKPVGLPFEVFGFGLDLLPVGLAHGPDPAVFVDEAI